MTATTLNIDQAGPRFACGISQCGACTVIVDGVAVRSCVAPCSGVANGAQVSTLDGLAKNSGKPNEKLHPLQTAFIAEQAAQCAFCMNGMVMGVKAWLDRRIASGNVSVPSDDEIRAFLSGKTAESAFPYICRCGAHNRIVRAIQRAAEEMGGMNTSTISRRGFLGTGTGTGTGTGSIVVGFSMSATLAEMAHAAPGAGGSLAVDSWFVVSGATPGGTGTRVTIYAGKVELGTGIQTALSQIVAEELNVEMSQLAYVQSDTDQAPGSTGYTAGSKSVQNDGPPMRRAAATAMQQLYALAAAQFGVSVSQLRAHRGRIG